MKLHGNTPMEWNRLSSPVVYPCSEKINNKKKKDRNELVGLYVCYLSEIYMQHYK